MSVRLFDANFYRAANRDLVGFNDEQAFSHLLTFGLNEGRQFSPLADLKFYRASNSDLVNLNNRQLFDHLQNSGVAEGRKFSQFFDVNYYRANNPDLVAARLNNEQLVDHFRIHGLGEGRVFSTTFDINYYRTHKPDLVEAGFNNQQSFEHFQIYGVQQGLLSSPAFNAKVYLENNSDLVAAFGRYNYREAYDHYNVFGQREGRPGSDYAGNSLGTARNLGSLSDRRELTDFVGSIDTEDYYSFNWNAAGNVSVFLNGLAAGTTIQLLNNSGGVLQSSTNSGATWNATDGSTTGGSITANLAAGTYYIRVTPATISGNPIYANKDFYTLTLQPHEAPNTVTVAASNSALKTGADYVATGTNDQAIINQAMAAVAARGGGTVVLLDGTFNIANNVEAVYDNITLSGVGWATRLRIANNTILEDAGLLRSAYHKAQDNINVKQFFTRQRFTSMVLDGNKANQTSAVNSYANFGTYKDSSFEDIRAVNFGAYGFDPHENSDAGVPTIKLTMKYNLADHNGKDGITVDNCVDSFFIGNIADANVRHGFNICTESRNNTFLSNVATNNGSNGFIIQSGTELERTSDGNKLIGNISRANKASGFYQFLASNTEYTDNVSADNSRHGIHLRSASSNTLRANRLLNNSQLGSNLYNEIYLDDNGSTFSTRNSVYFNRIVNNKGIRSRHAVTERSAGENFNTLAGNSFEGTLRGIKLLGANSKVIS